MSLPLWDPIDVPPDWTLVDINSIEDDDERQECQAKAMQAWLDAGEEIPREWDDNEGIFVVRDLSGEVVGIAIVLDVAGM